MDVSGFSSIQLQRFLIDKGFGEQVASNFQENEIDGAVFCERTAEGGCPEDKRLNQAQKASAEFTTTQGM